ncbi:MAG: hypothetical protein J7599_21760 [Niabella sp.]|nr:hypothetical protein [Niabella sp.]
MKQHIVIAAACMVAVLLVYMWVHAIGAPVNDCIKDRVMLQALKDREDQSEQIFVNAGCWKHKGFAMNRSVAGINK